MTRRRPWETAPVTWKTTVEHAMTSALVLLALNLWHLWTGAPDLDHGALALVLAMTILALSFVWGLTVEVECRREDRERQDELERRETMHRLTLRERGL